MLPRQDGSARLKDHQERSSSAPSGRSLVRGVMVPGRPRPLRHLETGHLTPAHYEHMLIANPGHGSQPGRKELAVVPAALTNVAMVTGFVLVMVPAGDRSPSLTAVV